MAVVLDVFDEFVAGASADELASWVAAGATIATEPVRCTVTDDDPAARQRLDLALRMLHTQEACQWCRGTDAGTVVVRRWPLPARVAALYDGPDGAPQGFVLALGRPGGRADAWRFRFDVPVTPLLDRGRALLPT